jgi:ubiquinone/menaquinone biosynthesis C-methylase UbiE
MTPAESQDAIWDYYQNEAPESFAPAEARHKYLVKYVRRGTRILNIGIGDGAFEARAVALGADVHALDPVAATVERTRAKLGLGEKARVGYSQALPFPDAHFDLVVVSEVLEHLEEKVLHASLAEVQRVIKPGGHVIGTVPARERLTDKTVVCPNCHSRFHRWGHMQSFDATRMRNLLGRHFRVVKVVERPFVGWASLNVKGKIRGLLKLAAWRAGVHASGESVFFHAQR